jgi:hypothetical protein
VGRPDATRLTDAWGGDSVLCAAAFAVHGAWHGSAAMIALG